MKALVCAKCFSIHSLPEKGWIVCECGNSRGRWIDPQRGIAEFDGLDRKYVWGLGIHNQYLREILPKAGMKTFGTVEDAIEAMESPEFPVFTTNLEFKMLHDHYADNADGYIFKTIGCPFAFFRPGSTSDTSFAESGKE